MNVAGCFCYPDCDIGVIRRINGVTGNVQVVDIKISLMPLLIVSYFGQTLFIF